MAYQKKKDYSRSRSRRRTVTYENQTDQPEEVDENTTVAELLEIQKANDGTVLNEEYLSPSFTAKKPLQNEKLGESSGAQPTSSNSTVPAICATAPPTEENSPDPQIEISKTNRPKSNGIAFPFKLNRSGTNKSLAGSISSTATITSALGVSPLNNATSGDGKPSSADTQREKDNDKGKGRENLKDERPGLETFDTAIEGSPLDNRN
jgi:sulfur carrier protein ThiS